MRPQGETNHADNPLMKLVDAASMVQSAQAQQTSPPSSFVPDPIPPRVENECNTFVTGSTLGSASSGGLKSIAGKSVATAVSCDSNEGKVIRGNKEDLFNVNRRINFAQYLMDILDRGKHSDVLDWTPDGKAFLILNPHLFVMERMEKLFNIRNMSSFVRKLTRWGFNRDHEKTTRNSDVFCHPMFRKGRRDLVLRIRCVYRPALKRSFVPKAPIKALPAPMSSGVHLIPNRAALADSVRRASLGHSGPILVTPPSATRALLHASPRHVFPQNPIALLRQPLFVDRSTDVSSRVISAAIDTLQRDGGGAVSTTSNASPVVLLPGQLGVLDLRARR